MRISSDEEENELKLLLWSLNGFECEIAANNLLGVNLKWSKNVLISKETALCTQLNAWKKEKNNFKW